LAVRVMRGKSIRANKGGGGNGSKWCDQVLARVGCKLRGGRPVLDHPYLRPDLILSLTRDLRPSPFFLEQRSRRRSIPFLEGLPELRRAKIIRSDSDSVLGTCYRDAEPSVKGLHPSA
jgi:hypothetical protein